MTSVLSYLLVGSIWGSTNVLMKLGADKAQDKGSIAYLKHVLPPFLLNLVGSSLFYYLLSSTPLSLVIPITNSLTQLFTLMFSRVLGEVRYMGRSEATVSIQPPLRSSSIPPSL